MKGQGPRCGLTLLEVAVAVSLLATSTLAFLSVFGSSLTLDHLNRERAWARDECRRQMETILAQPFANVPTFGQSPNNAFDVGFVVDANGPANRILLKPVPPAAHVGAITIDQTTNGDSSCCKVTVTATWLTAAGDGTKAGGQTSYSITADVGEH